MNPIRGMACIPIGPWHHCIVTVVRVYLLTTYLPTLPTWVFEMERVEA